MSDGPEGPLMPCIPIPLIVMASMLAVELTVIVNVIVVPVRVTGPRVKSPPEVLTVTELAVVRKTKLVGAFRTKVPVPEMSSTAVSVIIIFPRFEKPKLENYSPRL